MPKRELPDPVAAFARSRGLPPAFFSELNAAYQPGPNAIVYDWTGPGAHEIAPLGRRRYLNHDAGRRFDWNKPHGTPAPSFPFVYRPVYSGEGDTLLIVEGETDALTAACLGIPALGVPGASSWDADWWRYAEGYQRIVIVVESDPAGAKFLRNTALSCPSRLKDRLHAVTFGFAPWRQKDLNDLHIRKCGGDPDRTLAALASIPARPVRTLKPGTPQDLCRAIADRLVRSRLEGGDYKAVCPFHDGDSDGNNFDFGPLGVRCFNPACESMTGAVPGWDTHGKDGHGFEHVVLLGAMLGICYDDSANTDLTLDWYDPANPAPVEPPTAVVSRLIYPGAVHLFNGAAGAGKSTALLQLSLSVACGADFLGLKSARGRVLYLNYELPAWRVHDVLRVLTALCDAHSANPGPNALAFLHHPGFLLSDETSVQPIIDLAEREGGFDVIIIDTLASAFATNDENANAEACTQMRALRHLAEKTGAAVVVAHHIGTGNGAVGAYRGRGATARGALANLVINLIPNDRAGESLIADDESGGTFILELGKSHCCDCWRMKIRWSDLGQGFVPEKPSHPKTAISIVRLLWDTQASLSNQEIAQKTGIGVKTVTKTLSRLLVKHPDLTPFFLCHQPGNPAKPRTWQLLREITETCTLPDGTQTQITHRFPIEDF